MSDDATTFKRGRVPKKRPAIGYVSLFFDTSRGAFRYVDSDGTIANVASSSGGISEAPIDGTSYVRKNAGWVAAGAGSSVLTTKGDLWGYAAADARVAVGATGLVLMADSTNANGLTWDLGVKSSLPTATLTAASLTVARKATIADTARFTIGDGSTLEIT